MQNNIITINLKLPVFAVKVLEKSGYLPLEKGTIEHNTIYSILVLGRHIPFSNNVIFKPSTLVTQNVALGIHIPHHFSLDYHPDKLKNIQAFLIHTAKEKIIEFCDFQKEQLSLSVVDSVKNLMTFYEIDEDTYSQDSIITMRYERNKKRNKKSK
ncbi:hypothetical protein V9L05_01395 [Bernardetia sp. Wsw4-3y2]|uniref:hypothetical protein n=1 Tax=Bernardetia sp. Wsw4-3y2 TaxID=3127471 RepID=UPI0030D512AE